MGPVKLDEKNSSLIFKALESNEDASFIECGFDGQETLLQLTSAGLCLQSKTFVLFYAYDVMQGIELVGADDEEIRFIIPGIDNDNDRVWLEKWIANHVFDRLKRDFLAWKRSNNGQTKRMKI